MKKFISAMQSLLVAIVFATSPASAGNDDAEIAAILKADGDWLATSLSGEDFIGFTDPEFTFFPPGAPFMDERQQMIDHWNAIVTTPGLELVWAPTNAVVSEGGDLGFSYGAYTLTTIDEAGNENVSAGKYLTAMRKQPNGEWRPLADIFNAD
jgi:ketosteroid isomerase-like protein